MDALSETLSRMKNETIEMMRMHLKQRHDKQAASGFSLLEVMAATILIVIIAIGFSSALTSAARLRMSARLRDAALIQANSYMESAMALAATNTFTDGDTGYLTTDMQTVTNNPGIQWTFDGKNFPVKVTYIYNEPLVSIDVSILCETNRPVSLFYQKYVPET